MSESSSDLEPIHAAHLPDRAFSPMTISLDGLRSAIDRANGSLRTVNGPPISLPPHHTTSPSPPADNDPFNPRHITIMMLNHLRCITETTTAQRVVPLD
jgi:hypothetical protein